METHRPARTALLASSALAGFAANSLLCRAALRGGAIDAWSFTAVRLASGALVLGLLARTWRGGSWASALALVAYAGLFSLAYLLIPAGVGALVLFGAVQATMIGWSVRAGRRPRAVEWCGLVLALAGLAWLTLPGAGAPDARGLGLMACAGIAWGVYSLRGRSGRQPLLATAGNFARGALLVLPFAAFARFEIGTRGLLLASASGALASGLCYSLWYAALPGMSATRAALVQLCVPLLTAIAAVLLLGEQPSERLLCSGVAILGGIALAVLWPQRRSD
jgi:drug/metabolite transporter (DMT)-like permease